MKSKLIIRFALVFLVLLSCTKQIDDSILDVDIEELLVEVDPILSTQNTISSVDDVYLNGDVVESFDYEIIESDQFIRIVLPSGSNVSSVSIDFTMAENASLASSISGLNFTGTGIKLISVVAENGDTRTYALKIIVTGGVDPMPSPSEIISVTSVTASGIVVIPVEPAMFSDNSINVLLPAGTPLTDISFEFEITENSFLLDDATNLSFESGATNEVRLESEEGEVRIYTITVELENTPDLSDENDIIKITATIGDAPNITIIDEREAPEFDGSNSIILEVPFKTDISDVDLEFELSEFATLQIDDITTGLDFTGGVVKMFTVIAQDGSGEDQPYGIEVVVADPTEREALIEMYNGPDGIEEEFQWDLSEGSDIGLWTGVTTNADGKVIGLQNENDFGNQILSLDVNLKYLPNLVRISSIEERMQLPTNEEMDGVIFENLTNINSFLGFSSFPNWITNQPNITNISYEDSGKIIIPESIGSLKNLENLVIEYGEVEQLPESINGLTSLIALNLNGNTLTSLPESLAELPNLMTLNIENNPDLTSIPQAICDWGEIDGHQLLKDDTAVCDGEMPSISIDAQKRALLAMYNGDSDAMWDIDTDLSTWGGVTVDPATGNVIGLTFDSDFSPITNFNSSLGDLTYLTSINAGDSSFDFSQDVTLTNNLDNLTSISIDTASFSTFPNWIFTLPNLTTLRLDNLDGLNEIPSELGSIESLTVINIVNGYVTSFPQSIASLPNLIGLNISNQNDEILVISDAFCQRNDTDDDFTLTLSDNVICDGNTSDNNYLTSLYLSDANGIQYPADLADIENIAITIEVPFSTDVTNLETVFAFDSTAISSVNSPVTHNFESPLVIEITAENLDQREYTISITRAAMTQREALLSMYDESLDTNDDWNPDGDMNDWQGVTASGENVTEINFDGSSQSYIILNENLGILINLEKINFLEFDNGFGNGTRVPNTIVNNSFNSLTRFSAEFVNFEDSTIPEWIMNSSSLQELFLWETSGEEIPASIINLTELTTLVIERSLVTEIPDYVGQLTTLETLSVSEGRLNSVDLAITNLTNLKSFNLSDNALTNLPQEICDFGSTLDNFSIDATTICQTTYTPEIQTQRDALLSMTAGRSNWSEDTEMSTWEGITVDTQGNVTGLAKDGPSSLNAFDNFDRMEDLVYLKNFTYAYSPGFPNDVIPSTIFNLEGLETLNLSYLTLNEVSPEISRLKNLTDLTLFQTGLTEIPKEIAEIESLVNLNIQFNSITTIPQEICDLENSGRLTILKDADVVCGTLPTDSQIQREALLSMYDQTREHENNPWDLDGDWTTWHGVTIENGNVVALDFSDDTDYITNVNENLGKLTYLRSLDLDYFTLPNTIVTESGVELLPNLTYVGLDEIPEQTIIPQWVLNSTTLTSLYLERTGIDNLSGIGNLINLTSLRIPSALITDIPLEVFQLTSLTQLDLETNNITNIPTEITNLTNLNYLDLRSNNNLISITEQVCEFGQSLGTFRIDEDVLCGAYSVSVLKQRNALLSMYDETGGGNWSEDTDMNTWDNITLDTNGNIITYTYSGLNLSAPGSRIELNEDLNNLIYLKEIDVSFSNMSIIPPEIIELRNLERLTFKVTKLSNVPIELSQLPNLMYVDFSSNADLISIPQEFCDKSDTGTLELIKDDTIFCE